MNTETEHTIRTLLTLDPHRDIRRSIKKFNEVFDFMIDQKELKHSYLPQFNAVEKTVDSGRGCREGN